MLNEYRKNIDDIDFKLRELFIKRMEMVKNIKEYKLTNNLPVLDSNREKLLIEKLTKDYTDESTLKYYEEFIKKVISLSKEYQNE